MSSQFYCIAPEKIRIATGDEVQLLEGTAEKGPWYELKNYPEPYTSFWKTMGWIGFVESPAEWVERTQDGLKEDLPPSAWGEDTWKQGDPVNKGD